MRMRVLTLAAAAALFSAPAFAQGGAVVGVVAPPPPEVITYVTEQPIAGSVVFEGELVVGHPLPEVVVVQPVPDFEVYSYAVVNDRRVIVDASTRHVIHVID